VLRKCADAHRAFTSNRVCSVAVLSAILLAFLAVSPAVAQATLGAAALGGAVHDESGGAIPGAKISITHESSGAVHESESDSAGAFLFPGVPAGTYSVRGEKVGFSSEQMRGVRLDLGGQASVLIELRVGEIRTSITVGPPSATDLTAVSNTIGTIIDSAQMRELPLNGRDFLQLAKLAATTVETSSASNLFSSNVGPPNRTVVLPGTLPNSVSYFLNGINITSSRDGELAMSPSVSAIDQFRIQQSFVMSNQSSHPAIVNIVTRSGTNELHGEAWEFVRNGKLDARSFFAAGPEDLKRNQFGFALGGPVRASRVWFYAFYEALRERKAFSKAGYSPTREMFGGDFAATGRSIFDPATFDPATGTRKPFPNSVIPSNRINSVAASLLTYYRPGSSLSSIPSNVFGTPVNRLNDDQGGVRLDAMLNTRQQVFFQLFRQNTPTDLQELYPLSGLLYMNNADLAMAQHTWTVSPRIANTLRLGFVHSTAIGTNEATGAGPAVASLGISNTFGREGVPAVNLQGYSPFGRSNGDVGNRDNTWQLNEEFTISSGRHAVALGAAFAYRRGWHANGNSAALGSLSFQPAFTAQLTRNEQAELGRIPNTGDAFADFLLGMPSNGLLTGAASVAFRSVEFVPFFHDTWKLRPGLTLNYGLSWQVETPPHPQGKARDIVHTFDNQTGLLKFAGLGQTEPRLAATDMNNVAPRLGVAWRPAFLKDTVVRASAGLYYTPFPWSFAAYPVGPGAPSSAGASFTNAATNPLPVYTLGVNIFPPGGSGGLTPQYATSLPRGTVATALNPGFRTGYVGQWNLSLQHSFSPNDTVQLTYMGSSGHRLANVMDLSQCRPTPDLFCSAAAKRWPRYGLLLYGDSSGNSSYEGLLARYDRRVSSGVNLQFEYAFAKALTDSYQSSLTIYSQMSECRRCSKGPATFDVRHRAVASLIWDVPFGRGRPFARHLPAWADLAAGGWTLTTIATFAGGQPIYLTAPNQTGSALISVLPNRVCDGRSDALSGDIRNNGFLWFNTRCFPAPSPGYFGNSGPTVLNGPGLNNWDIGIHKSFALKPERTRLEVRGELFNAWNHTQFGQPNPNAGAGANFGRISATRPPRLVQLALKIYW
jgi:hypothetical protein